VHLEWVVGGSGPAAVLIQAGEQAGQLGRVSAFGLSGEEVDERFAAIGGCEPSKR
jgi:hypothetical protein